MTEITALVESIALILQAICWPMLVITILFWFKKPLSEFFANLGEFTFKASPTGLEASGKKFEATANLAVATAKQDNEKSINTERAGKVGRTVEQFSDRQILKLSGKRLLWVDDNPQNNIYEQKALQALGIEIAISLSTEDALEKIRTNHFDVIISDISRKDIRDAGFLLLSRLKELGSHTPFIFYSSSTSPQKKQEARSLGAYDRTDLPEELFQSVLNSLLNED